MCSEDKYDDKKIRERLVQHLLLEHEAHFDNQEDAADAAEDEAELGASVMKAFDKLRESYGSKWNQIFKSITNDNGSEFADLSDLEQVSKTLAAAFSSM